MPDVGPFIVVLGLPSGGTSAVARTLLALGVDMGRVRRLPKRRRLYSDYECTRLQAIMRPLWDPDRDWEDACLKVHAYIDRRMRRARKPQGAKYPAFARITNAPRDLWTSLPIRTVNVHRPLDEVLKSNLHKLGKNKSPDQRRNEILTLDAERATFLDVFPPACTVNFSDLLADPIPQADAIARALGLPPLTPDDRRARRVLRAVKPRLRRFGPR